jgi:hypothetical protein
MQIVYTRKPKIHMLQKGKAVCGRRWLDGEEEGSKFAGSVDCKDCLRLLTQRAADETICTCTHDAYESIFKPVHCDRCGKPFRR